ASPSLTNPDAGPEPAGSASLGLFWAGGVGTSASICTLAELVQLLGQHFLLGEFSAGLGRVTPWSPACPALVLGHYAAGRSRCSELSAKPLSMARLGDLTQRLIETVSEPGEDHRQSSTRDWHSWPAERGDGSIMNCRIVKSPVQLPKQLHHQQQQHLIDESDPQQQHIRSTSYTAGISHGSPAHNQHSVGAASAVNSCGVCRWRVEQASSSRGSTKLTLSLRILGQLVDRLQEQHQPPRLRASNGPTILVWCAFLGRACCPVDPLRPWLSRPLPTAGIPSPAMLGNGAAAFAAILCDAFPGLGPALVRQALGQLEAWPAVLLPHSQGALHAALLKQIFSSTPGVQVQPACRPPRTRSTRLCCRWSPCQRLSQPPRRELPGRTLNFTFDVRSEDQIGGAAQSAQQQQQQHHPAAAAAFHSVYGFGCVGTPAIGGGGGGSLSSSDSGQRRRCVLAEVAAAACGGSSSGGGGGTSGGDRHLPQVPRVRIRLVGPVRRLFWRPSRPAKVSIARAGRMTSCSRTRAASELRYYNIVGFIDDQLGFLNIEDPDSPTHPATSSSTGVSAVSPFYKRQLRRCRLRPGRRRLAYDLVADSAGRSLLLVAATTKKRELVAALPQREPATGASLSPSSAPSTSPQEEPPGPGSSSG
uniref:Protein kinase domain-containing protein n=1 Tax=Macrostomum lignano TaxID=282301 RepID=A0A1I8FAN9_9PLAT